MRRFYALLFVMMILTAGLCLQPDRTSATDEITVRRPVIRAVVNQPTATQPQRDEKADDKKVEDEDEGHLSKFMSRKLSSSSQILKGLMIEDFDLIKDNADSLLKMSKQERWRASNDMMYLQHSTQFRSAVDELIDAAESKSVDGASLQWVNVTMSCIQCHKWVRDVMLADLEPPSFDLPQQDISVGNAE